MTTHSRPFALSAACLATTVALAITTPTVAETRHSIALATPTVTSSYELLADSQTSREVGYGDWAGLFTGFAEILGGLGQLGNNYLDANQAGVLAFTANLPTLMLGPVAIGGGLLADAWFNGYGGATGPGGVFNYITSAFNPAPSAAKPVTAAKSSVAVAAREAAKPTGHSARAAQVTQVPRGARAAASTASSAHRAAASATPHAATTHGGSKRAAA